MDAFEQLVAEILWSEGYWVQMSVKVNLTKAEKREIRRPSSPRWELDVVGYKGRVNELLVIECKNFLNSGGVGAREVCSDKPHSRYKLFTEPKLRDVVLARLSKQFVEAGTCRGNPEISLGLAAGNVKNGDEEKISKRFRDRGWLFWPPSVIREKVSSLASGGYENQVSSVVTKILLND